MRGVLRFALVAALASGALGLGAQDTAWALSGSVERADSALWSEAGGFAWSGGSTLELGLSVSGEGTRAEAAVRARLLGGAAAEELIAALADPAAPGMLGQTLVLPLAGAEGAGALLLDLRSLQARLDLGWARLRAGRQIVNLGRGLAFSPADAFASRDLSGLSPERVPVDALRLSGALGGLAGWDLLAAPRAEPVEGRYAARLFAYVAGLDASLLAGRDGAAGDWLGAADLQFDLGATLRGEALLRVSDAGSLRLSASGGVDWSLGDLVLAAEYYRNGQGSAGAIALSEAGPSDSSDFLYASLSWAAGDFLSLSASALADLGAGLWAPALSAAVDAAQNARLVISLRGLIASSKLETADLAASLALSF